MPPQDFRVVARPGTTNDVRILGVSGAISLSSSPEFQAAVAQETAPRLILDLTDVPFIDSMAIGALVRAFATCTRAGRKLVLVGINHRVRNVLQLTNVDSLFDVYSTIAEAEQSFN